MHSHVVLEAERSEQQERKAHMLDLSQSGLCSHVSQNKGPELITEHKNHKEEMHLRQLVIGAHMS